MFDPGAIGVNLIKKFGHQSVGSIQYIFNREEMKMLVINMRYFKLPLVGMVPSEAKARMKVIMRAFLTYMIKQEHSTFN